MTDDFDLSQYPENTLLSLLVIDIYADYDDVTIIYDRPFVRELLQIEFVSETSELIFEFEGGKIPYGEPIIEDIAEILEEVDIITLIQMDLATKKAIFGMEVPLKTT